MSTRTMPWDKDAEYRRAWGYDQIKSFVKEIRKDAGDAWSNDWMTPRMRRAIIAERAFCIVRSQDRVTVSVEAMNQLLLDLEVAFGLREVGS